MKIKEVSKKLKLFFAGAIIASTATIVYAADKTITAPSGNLVLDASSDIILDSGVTINESGADVDFRVEGTGQANAFFVDGANGRVGVKTNSPEKVFHVYDDSRSGPYFEEVTDSVSNAPVTFMRRRVDTGVTQVGEDGDELTFLSFRGYNDAGTPAATTYAQINAYIVDSSSTNPAGKLDFVVQGDGTNNGEIVFNENSGDVNFRIESDNNINAFYFEGSNGNVGIGVTAHATRKFFVQQAVNDYAATIQNSYSGANGVSIGTTGATGTALVASSSSVSNILKVNNSGDVDFAASGATNVPIITAWAAYTPTFTPFGTVTEVDFKWRRVGDTLEVEGTFLTGTIPAAAGTGQFSLPSGLAWDSSYSTRDRQHVGRWTRLTSATYEWHLTSYGEGMIWPLTFPDNTNRVALVPRKFTGNTIVATADHTSTFLTSGDAISVRFSIRISTWTTGTNTVYP